MCIRDRDTPTSGTYLLEGLNVAELTDDELAEVRALRIGFVFSQLSPQLEQSCVHSLISLNLLFLFQISL